MLSDHLRVLYLHGFASGSTSRKAQFFRQRLADFNVRLEIPELCEGTFEHLTITGQLHVVEREIVSAQAPGEGLVLIGSSLGGYLAALFASRHPEVDRLLLLAPAFDFHRLWVDSLGPERLALWRNNGTMPIFHYGQGREVPLGYQLMEDASGYEAYPVFGQPALIFHGTRDPVVPVQYAAAFAREHENARLVELDSGHELTDVLDEIWRESQDFLLGGTRN